MCLSYALLTHLCVMRKGGQSQWTRGKMADILGTAAHDVLRIIPWDDVIVYNQEESHGDAVTTGHEQRRITCNKYESVNVGSLP